VNALSAAGRAGNSSASAERTTGDPKLKPPSTPSQIAKFDSAGACCVDSIMSEAATSRVDVNGNINRIENPKGDQNETP
jgi:hypothetical protein